MLNTIYKFKANSLQGKEILLEQYKNKVVLIVNTASKCGLTPQYNGLQSLHEKYSSAGLAILGFPCNQFSNQEPGTATEIKNNCLINYGVTFQMFEKIKVNGINAHPLYKFLKEEQKGFLGTKKIKWNFTKFLVNVNGTVVKRFSSTTKPEAIEKDVVELLKDIK